MIIIKCDKCKVQIAEGQGTDVGFKIPKSFLKPDSKDFEEPQLVMTPFGFPAYYVKDKEQFNVLLCPQCLNTLHRWLSHPENNIKVKHG
jgi:hypothetical protein